MAYCAALSFEPGTWVRCQASRGLLRLGFLLHLSFHAFLEPLVDQVLAETPRISQLGGRQGPGFGHAVDLGLAQAQVGCHLGHRHDPLLFLLGCVLVHRLAFPIGVFWCWTGAVCEAGPSLCKKHTKTDKNRGRQI